jgi:hypothetical protein
LDVPGPILDYASRRTRVKVRLPANSVLSISIANGCLITETLSGKESAIGAIVFAVFVLAVMIGSVIDSFAFLKRDTVIPLVCLALFIVGLILLIIHNTWRKTILSVRGENLTLHLSAPLIRSKHHAWPTAQVSAIRVVPTDEGGQLGEVRMYFQSSGEAHLFTDHPFREVQYMANAIQRALNGGEEVLTAKAEP